MEKKFKKNLKKNLGPKAVLYALKEIGLTSNLPKVKVALILSQKNFRKES